MNTNKMPRLIALSLSLFLGGASLMACGESAEEEVSNTEEDTSEAEETVLSAGHIDICFELPEGDALAGLEESFEKALDGTVVFDKPVGDVNMDDFERGCSSRGMTISRVLQVEAEAEQWTVGYGAMDQEKEDLTPNVDFEAGQNLRLTLKLEHGHGTFYTFAARAEDGVFLTMNDGYVASLVPSEIEGLTVDVGEPSGASDQVECGTRDGHRLTFNSEGSITLGSGAGGSVELGEGPAEVMNVAAWTYDPAEANCNDAYGPNAWMAWRESAL